MIKKIDKKKIIKKIGYDGNEISAIIDLIIGKQTKKIFIGCHNFNLKRGSSFSYTICNTLDNTIKAMIDLDDIRQPYQLHF